MKKLAIIATSLVVCAATAFAFAGSGFVSSPCDCCARCACAECLCNELGCACDAGGDCFCGDLCCVSGGCCSECCQVN